MPKLVQSPSKKLRREGEKLGSLVETAASICEDLVHSQTRQQEEEPRSQEQNGEQSDEHVTEVEWRIQSGETAEAGPKSSKAEGGSATIDGEDVQSASGNQPSGEKKASAGTDGSGSSEEFEASSQADGATRHRQSSGAGASTSGISQTVRHSKRESRSSPGWLHGGSQSKAGDCQPCRRSFLLSIFQGFESNWQLQCCPRCSQQIAHLLGALLRNLGTRPHMVVCLHS